MEASGTNVSFRHDRIINSDFVKLFLGFHFFMLNLSIFNLLPHYLELRGTTEALYGAIAGTMGVASVTGIILLGHRADHWSRKSTVVFYMGLGLIGNVVAILAMQLPVEYYFISRAAQGLALALGLPIVFAWALETCPEDKKQEVMAWIGIAGLVANSLGPLIAEFIMTQFPVGKGAGAYYWVFIVAMGLQTTSFGFFLLTRNSRAYTDDSATTSFFGILFRSHSSLVLVVMLLFGGIFGVFISFGKNYAVSVDLSYVSVLFSAYTVGAVLSRVFITPVTKLLTPRHMIAAGFVGVGLSLWMLIFVENYWELGFLGAFYGFSHGVLYPTLIVRFIEAQKATEIGRSTILIQGAFSGGWGLFPYLGGVVLEFSNFPTLFSLLTAIAGLGILLHLWSDKRLSRSNPF